MWITLRDNIKDIIPLVGYIRKAFIEKQIICNSHRWCRVKGIIDNRELRCSEIEIRQTRRSDIKVVISAI